MAHMETVQQILVRVRLRDTCTRQNLYQHFKRLNIKPKTRHRRPQLYPEGTTEKIVEWLKQNGRVLSMTQLRAVKRQAQKARAA